LGFFTMRIQGTNGAALATAPVKPRRASGGTFTVSEEEAPRNSTAAGSLRAISTVDALMALQGVEDPAERKKRALIKGRNALDVLDSLKLGLLDGSVDGSTLARLKVAAEGLTEQTGDPGLDTVLGEIDLRVAVELAKAGIREG
jgi:Class II flagellar assembly regulator